MLRWLASSRLVPRLPTEAYRALCPSPGSIPQVVARRFVSLRYVLGCARGMLPQCPIFEPGQLLSWLPAMPMEFLWR